MPVVLRKEVGGNDNKMAITLRYGRTAMDDDDIANLCEMVQGAQTHIEIGTLWGGSAIAVALANTELQVICIDPFIGYYGTYDKWSGDTPNMSKVEANMAAHGVRDRIRLIRAKSQPFPFTGKADTGFIDGDHSYETVWADWHSLDAAGCKRIAVHDMDDPEVLRAVTRAQVDGKTFWLIYWQVIMETKRMAVFERCE